MTVFTPEENLNAVDVFIAAIHSLGYQPDVESVSTWPVDYAHSYVLVTEKTKKVLKFRNAGEKIDVFHGVFTLASGSRTLNTWNIPSQQKLKAVLGKLSNEDALVSLSH